MSRRQSAVQKNNRRLKRGKKRRTYEQALSSVRNSAALHYQCIRYVK